MILKTIERIPILALVVSVNSCARSSTTNSETLRDQNLQKAEALIDAFYSFDRAELEPFFSTAEGSAPKLLFYQGWAEGGNYKIVDPRPAKLLLQPRSAARLPWKTTPSLLSASTSK